MDKDDQISQLTMQISNINMRNREMADNRFKEELDDKDRQISKINSEYISLKSTISMLEDDRNYNQENYRKVNGQLFSVRNQMNQLQDENTTLSEQLYQKNQELNRLSFSVQNTEMLNDQISQKDAQISRLRT